MIVRTIAYTLVDQDQMEESGWQPYPFDEENGPAEPDLLAEFAGRNCYQSWDRPNPATSENVDYVANLLLQQHFSVLEHASVTFYIAGVSRSFLTELSRHRHLSLSVLSQRYVDESESEFVMPPQLKEANMVGKDQFSEFMGTIRNVYSVLFDTMIGEGYTKKEARQAARCVLPNATETQIVVTGNMRTWREMIQKRTGVTVDAEFRMVALELLRQLKEIAPATFQDM
jgi:thymidylate synthase (FAD)